MPYDVLEPEAGGYEVIEPESKGYEVLEPEKPSSPVNTNPYEQARLSGAVRGPMGPFGSVEPTEILSLPQVLKIPGAIAAPVTEAASEMTSDFLRRTGIDPSATPGKPLINIPRVPAYPFSPLLGKTFEPLEKVGGEFVSGLTEPGALVTAPLLAGEGALARGAAGLFGAQATSEVPEQAGQAIQTLYDPNSTFMEKAGALAKPALTGGFAALMGRQALAPKVTAATYTNPKTGETTTGAHHVEAAAKQGVDAEGPRETREAPEFGFQVESPQGTQVVSRDTAEKVAERSGQKIEEPATEKIHSNEIASPVEPEKALSEVPQEASAGPGAQSATQPAYPAISQLADQLKAAPVVSEKQAVPVRERIADAWSEGKTLAQRALGKLVAVGEGIKQTAIGLRNINDAERRVGHLDKDLQTSMLRSRNAGRAIERQMPNQVMRDAVALWIDTPGDPATKSSTLKDALTKLPAETPNRIRRAVEQAGDLPPDAVQFAESLRQYFGARENDAVSQEIFQHGLADYYTHIWRKESNMPNELRQAISTGKVNSYFQFARQRKIGMFLDGILQGKVPELDPAKVIPFYNYALDRSIASRQFVNDLSKINASDGRPAVAPTGVGTVVSKGSTPDALIIKPRAKPEEINDYRAVDHPALRKWKWIGTDTEGKPVLQLSDLLVHPEFYERIARMMDRGRLSGSPTTRTVLRVGAEVKAFKLGMLSAFHQIHVGSHALWHWTNPFEVSKKEWIDAQGDINPDHPFVQRAIQNGHLKIAPEAGELNTFSEGLLSGGLAHKVPFIGPWARTYSEWLFTRYIPKLKLATYENALARNLKWYGNKASPEAIEARVGDAVNSAYGELNQLFLGKEGRQPWVQRLLRGIFLAPDFGEARLRFAGKAATKFGGEERLALATMAVTMYAAARTGNMLSHGDPEMDPKRAFMVKAGNHWWTMRSVLGDMVHAATDFSNFLRVRLSPLYGQPVLAVLSGRDPKGLKQPITELLKQYPKNALMPIQLGGLSRDDQRIWESFITSMGATALPDLPHQDVATYVREWKSKSGDPKLKHEVERAQQETLAPSDYNNLRHYLYWEDQKSAMKEVQKLRDMGKSDKQILQAFAINKPFTGSVKLENRFRDSLTEPQRKIYERARQDQIKLRDRLQSVISQMAVQPQ